MPTNPRPRTQPSRLPALAVLAALAALWGGAVLWALAAPGPVQAQAATLEGRVRVSEEIDGRLVRLEDHSNAVVFVSGFREPPQPDKEHVLFQRDKQFSDRVVAITQGESVSFPNLDGIHHNVWSRSRPKSFDLGLYKFPETRVVPFETPGLITVFCNIHAQMISTILVLPNARYAITGADGSFRIEGVRPGTFPVYAWVEGATPQKHNVEFDPSGTAMLEIDLILKRIPIRHLNKEGKPYENY